MDEQFVALLLTEEQLWDFFYKLLLGDVDEIIRAVADGEVESTPLSTEAEFESAVAWRAVSAYLRANGLLPSNLVFGALARKLGEEAAAQAQKNNYLLHILDLVCVQEAKMLYDTLKTVHPQQQDFIPFLTQILSGSKLKVTEEQTYACQEIYDSFRAILAETNKHIVIYCPPN